jgi:PAS domain S-box-containing protein
MFKWPLFKLRDQLLITLVLVGLVPSLIISYETFLDNKNQALSYSTELAQKKLQLVAQSISSEFQEAESLIKMYARLPQLQDAQYNNIMPFLRSELAFLAPKYEKFIVGLPNGHFLNTSGGNRFQGGIRTFNDAIPEAKPRSIAYRDYWQKTVKNNLSNEAITYTSNPMISYTTGVKQVVVASTILDKNKKVAGMIGLSMPWEYIHELVQNLIQENFSYINENAKVMLVSGDGTFWYHWDKDKIIQLRTKNGQFVINKSGEKEIIKFNILNEQNTQLSMLGAEMLNGKTGISPILFNESPHHLVYQPITGSRYSIGLILDNEPIMTPVKKRLNHILFIVLASCLIIIALGLIFSYVLSNPIAELIKKISLLALGQTPNKRVKTQTKELQILTDAIFNLYDKIDQQSRSLEKSQELFSLVVKGSNDGIWDWDLLEQNIYLSPRWKEIIGYADNELENSIDTVKNHIHPDDKVGLDKLFKSLINNGSNNTNTQCRFRMLTKDGSYVSILTRCIIVRDEHEKALRIIGSNTDITELVKREQEVIELNKQLESKVFQRTKDLVNALKKAEEANDAKSNFLSNMSHELRTPMNGIIGLTNLCLTTDLDDQQRDYLDKVILSSKNLLKILNEILDFNKIESNMVELELTEVDLFAIAQQIQSLMKPAAEEKGIDFKLTLDPTLPSFVLTDPFRLSQVLLNLCGNAIKFTDTGQVELSIKHADSSSNEKINILFSVSDTGIGIQNTDKLFTPFKQEDASTTRKYGGTGLGLSISKKIVSLLGGELQLESQLEQGSCFYFSLTVQKSKITNSTSLKQVDKTTSHQAHRVNTQILLVEDNPINQLIAEEILKKAGYLVTKAENGKEALAQLKEQEFELVLMDIQMPIMDGETTTRIIRTELGLEELPIIALTANVLPEQINQYLKAGFSGFVGKPFHFEELLNEIQSHLKQAKEM